MSVALQYTTGDSLIQSLKSSCFLVHLFSLPIFLMAWGLLLMDVSLNFTVLLFCCCCNVWCCVLAEAVSPPAPCHPCLAPGQCRDNVRAVEESSARHLDPAPAQPSLLPEHWSLNNVNNYNIAHILLTSSYLIYWYSPLLYYSLIWLML